jgi:hypothetical protein
MVKQVVVEGNVLPTPHTFNFSFRARLSLFEDAHGD